MQTTARREKSIKRYQKEWDPTNIPKRGGRRDTSTRKYFLRLHKVWGLERETVFLHDFEFFCCFYFLVLCVFFLYISMGQILMDIVDANQIVFRMSGSNMVLRGTTVHQSYAELWILCVSVCWSTPPCLPGSSKRQITQLNNTLSIVFCC